MDPNATLQQLRDRDWDNASLEDHGSTSSPRCADCGELREACTCECDGLLDVYYASEEDKKD